MSPHTTPHSVKGNNSFKRDLEPYDQPPFPSIWLFLPCVNSHWGSDLIILSSWLDPLATGKIRDGGNEGSFDEHVMATVSHFILLLSNNLGSIFISVQTKQRRISFSATAGLLPA